MCRSTQYIWFGRLNYGDQPTIRWLVWNYWNIRQALKKVQLLVFFFFWFGLVWFGIQSEICERCACIFARQVKNKKKQKWRGDFCFFCRATPNLILYAISRLYAKFASHQSVDTTEWRMKMAKHKQESRGEKVIEADSIGLQLN